MEEIFVALMGVTGSGKSSFIKLCSTSSQEIEIGHTLDPCTTTINVYQCQYNASTKINLIDTPGFDDANRTDAEVLREITPWLAKKYREKIRLSGIIYLHRITDIRMQGSARRNLIMFKALCGPDALKNVVLATTMWDKAIMSEGERRETQLCSTADWWGFMREKGSTVLRHDNTQDSAMCIIGRFVSQTPVALQIQHDIVDLGKAWDQTQAGVELNRERAEADEESQKKLKQLEKEFNDALRQRDQEAMDAIAEIRNESEADRRRRDESFRKLQITMHQMDQEQRRYRALERQLQAIKANRKKEVSQLQAELQLHSKSSSKLVPTVRPVASGALDTGRKMLVCYVSLPLFRWSLD